MEVLVIIDLQNDFIDGTLGNTGNDQIIEPIENLIEDFDGEVIFTSCLLYTSPSPRDV